ncbi:hypothetical protein HYDPIDRAFT_29195 [Hydnomerulius pinastri MD-312]|uniref:NB-ARC domain-containing protein n=1 Tax=Hydnomerulius pinastri MD-312 TaxID=994086 RepID=A0A0C9VZH3_9AGAM|nr:hypothetical protein HYDPIDRAFT_29195 [Hydnomerulius pinastri MD-312]
MELPTGSQGQRRSAESVVSKLKNMVSRVRRNLSATVTTDTSSTFQQDDGMDWSEDIATLLDQTMVEVGTAQQLVSSDATKEALLLISKLLAAIKDTGKNKDAFRGLIFQCNRAGRVLRHASQAVNQDGVPSLEGVVSELKSLIIHIIEALPKNGRHGFWSRKSSLTSGTIPKIDEWVANFDRVLSLILLIDTGNTRTHGESTPSNVRALIDITCQPPALFGRDEAVNQIVKILITSDHRHVILCGSGGSGKNTLAKAVLNDPGIGARYEDRWFFIHFDDLHNFQMTYDSFINHVARELQVSASNITSHPVIVDFLGLGDVLLVFDCAEMFLDLRSSEGARIRKTLTEFGTLPGVTIMMTSRSTELPSSFELPYTLFHVPDLQPESAHEAFCSVYQTDDATSMAEWLSSMGIHNPLSVNLLARAADANKWTVKEIRDAWDARRDRSMQDISDPRHLTLGHCIEVSLHAPSTRWFRGEAKRTLAVLALLPQGVPKRLASLVGILSSLPYPVEMVAILCKHGLLYPKGEFYTMNPSVRQYMLDAVPPEHLDVAILKQVRLQFPYLLAQESTALNTIVLQDSNAEAMVAFELANLSLPDVDLETACKHLATFVHALLRYKPRPTCLRGVLTTLAGRLLLENSTSELEASIDLGPLMKAFAVFSAYHLAIGEHAASVDLFKITHDLALAQGESAVAMECICHQADACRMLGQYRAAKELIERAQESSIWECGSVPKKGFASWVLSMSKLQMEVKPEQALFTESSAHFQTANVTFGLHVSKALEAFTLGAVDGDWRAARMRLEASLASITDDDDDQGPYLYTLAPVAFLENQLDKAQEYVHRARECYLRDGDMIQANRMLVEEALICGHRRQFEEATELLHQATTELEKLTKPSPQNECLALYTSACISLWLGTRAEAKLSFERVRNNCTEQQEYHLRAQCLRALGEIMFLDGDVEAAGTAFDTIVTLCRAMGIPPTSLYRSHVLRGLGNQFKQWQAFLNGSSPVTVY